MRNLLFIGFMGAGKTTVSNAMSRITKRLVIDTDHEIEKREGRKIKEIFETEGEAYFRKAETELLRKLSDRKDLLISCGGGMALKEENRKLMKECGTVVLLTVEPETVLGRIKDTSTRPLLKDRKDAASVKELMDLRAGAYTEAADIVVTTDGKTPEEICREILEAEKAYV